MDQEMEAELREILHKAEVQEAATAASHDVDMLILVESLGALGLKSAVLTNVLNRGVDYTSAVLTGVVVKCRSMARVALANNEANLAGSLLPPDDDECVGHVRAHEFTRELLLCATREEGSQIGTTMTLVMDAIGGEQYARMALHMTELAVGLLTQSVDLQDKQLRGVLGLDTEDEGDS